MIRKVYDIQINLTASSKCATKWNSITKAKSV
jgi:hypothetical protein